MGCAPAARLLYLHVHHVFQQDQFRCKGRLQRYICATRATAGRRPSSRRTSVTCNAPTLSPSCSERYRDLISDGNAWPSRRPCGYCVRRGTLCVSQRGISATSCTARLAATSRSIATCRRPPNLAQIIELFSSFRARCSDIGISKHRQDALHS